MYFSVFILGLLVGMLITLRAVRESKTCEVAEDPRPLSAALMVGVSYLCGALFPIFPVLLGAESLLWPISFGVFMVIVVSVVVSLVSGMEVRRRVLQNLLLVFGAIAVTYSIGALVRNIWGIDV